MLLGDMRGLLLARISTTDTTLCPLPLAADLPSSCPPTTQGQQGWTGSAPSLPRCPAQRRPLAWPSAYGTVIVPVPSRQWRRRHDPTRATVDGDVVHEVHELEAGRVHGGASLLANSSGQRRWQARRPPSSRRGPATSRDGRAARNAGKSASPRRRRRSTSA